MQHEPAATAAETATAATGRRDRRDRRRRGRKWGPLRSDTDDRAAWPPVSSGSMASRDAKNTLNDLTRGEWREFALRVVIGGGGGGAPWTSGMSGAEGRRRGPSDHPDAFPPGLAECMVAFFTRRGGTVLDPFVGTGSTLAACDRLGRRGLGIELYAKWAGIARGRTRQTVVCADAADAARIAAKAGMAGGNAGGRNGGRGRGVDLLLAGIPRPFCAAGRKAQYMSAIGWMSDACDASMAGTYEEYLRAVETGLAAAIEAVRPGGHIVLALPNEAKTGRRGRFLPAAFDLSRRIGRMAGLEYAGEKVWLAPPPSPPPPRRRGGHRAGKRRTADGGGSLHGYPHRYAAGSDGTAAALYCLIFAKCGGRPADANAGTDTTEAEP